MAACRLRQQADDGEQIEQIATMVLASDGYRAISRDLVERVVASELGKRRTVKEAVRATKSRLHQVANAYLPTAPHYDTWLGDLRTARETSDPQQLRAACRRIMAFHASTRERLPILDDFYTTTLASCAPIHSLIDIACGLNPLAAPWMPLAPGCTYTACDAVGDMISLVGAFLGLAGLRGNAVVCDVVGAPPRQPADVALVLKALPCLEHIDRDAAPHLLDAISARWLLVSFPVRSLGGRNKGMLATYEERFLTLARTRAWQVQRFVFATELAFLVNKEPSSGIKTPGAIQEQGATKEQ